MEKRKRRILHSLTIKEISGVDVPAQEGARVLISKRHEVSKNVADMVNPQRTNATDGHQHLVDDSGMAGHTSWELSEGKDQEHRHHWLRTSDGTIDILMTEGHDHELLAKSAGGADALATEKGIEMADKQEDQTADDNAVQLAKVEARAERAETMAQLTDAQKAHLSKLDDAGKDAFLKMDGENRQYEVQKAAAGNPVVYKSANGREFRESDSKDLVDMAKLADEALDMAKAERDLRLDSDLAKRADALGNIAGDAEVKKALLKAIDSIPDAELRKGALEIVTAANSGMEKSFTRRGTEKGAIALSAEEHYENMAKAYAKEHDVTIVKARAEVLMTTEGADVYADMTSQPVAID